MYILESRSGGLVVGDFIAIFIIILWLPMLLNQCRQKSLQFSLIKEIATEGTRRH
jgi:hypothetical protein